MNLERYEEVQFTDNLCQAYEDYQPAPNVDAKVQTKYLLQRVELYRQKVNELRSQFFLQNATPQEDQKLIGSVQEAFVAYFTSHNEAKDLDFDGSGFTRSGRAVDFTEDSISTLLQSNKSEISQSFTYINHLAYLQTSFFGDLKSEWDLRVSKTMMETVLTLPQDKFEILLFYISLISRGIFFLHKQIGPNIKHFNWANDSMLAYTVHFCEAFDKERAVVGYILPERVPIAHQDKNQLKEFQYRQYVLLNQMIEILDLLHKRKELFEPLRSFLVYDDDRYGCFQFQNVNLRRDVPKGELHISTQYKHLFNGDIISFYIRPLKIFKWMLKEPLPQHCEFDEEKRRWFAKVVVNESDNNKANQIVKVEEEVIQKMDKEESTKKLVQILDMMPTLNIKLNQYQKSIISSNYNLLCLGRSGTGKTTTSVLRLFAQEILYAILKKHQEQIEKEKKARALEEQKKAQGQIVQDSEKKEDGEPEELKKPKAKKVNLQSSDLEQNTGIKMVFITASPVLTTEVKRFYSNIKQKLIHHMRRREEAKEKALQQEAFQNISEQEANEIIEKAVAEQEQNETKVIEDHEMKEMLEFIKKEEKDLVEDLQIENQMNIPNSFDDLESRHFPLFITVKRLIYMMDACLNYSFFSRDHNNNIIGLDSNLGWHNESKGVMMINHYYKEHIDYDEQIAKFGKELLEMDKEAEIDNDTEDVSDAQNFMMIQEEQAKQTGPTHKFVGYYHNRAHEKYLLERQQLSFEVDYDVFEAKFWPKIGSKKNMKKLQPTLVWTEIYSVIKGGQKSCNYYMGYLPKHIYLKEEASDFLYLNEKKAIYYIFLEYEKWKAEQRAYDFMDVVNHIQKRLWYGEAMRRMRMDYLMVDEVQDLTPKTLQILLKLTSHNVFFAGDTAQTIAKGVGARFLDLRHIFSSLDYEVPKIVQLTTNYRSHGRILDLANSVVSLIELFFPKTIDKLVKEESESDGMKPVVIMPLDGRQMRSLFTGTSMTSDKDSALAAPQFGCNQVLIVRDQAAKDMVPDIFRNMLILSVYEAKGLEFDDVILYNFFHLGDVSNSQWKLLNDIVYENVKRPKYKQDILDFDALDAENFEAFMRKVKEQENEQDVEYEEDMQLNVNKHRDEVYRKFSMLCIELKFLYVAITRPKRRLIIYDDVADGRKPIQMYWEKLNLINLVTREQVANPAELEPQVREIFETGALAKERSTQDEWRIQGIKLFKKKYYDASMKCFSNSGDEDLVKRCMAYQEADVGQIKMSEADSKTWRAKVFKNITKVDKKRMIKEAKKERLIAKKHFENAGSLFEQIRMLKHAASCFYTGRNFAKAAQIFEELGQYGQAAECLMQINELKKAARLYEQANLITRAIECLESCGEWEQLLHCLHRNKDFFKQEERQSLINKYVPVALNSLYKLYTQEDGEDEIDEENKGKMQEMKIKLKYQKKVDVIAEEDEEFDEEEEDETVDDNEIEQIEEEEEKKDKEVGNKPDDEAQTQDDQNENEPKDGDEMVDLIDEEEDIPDILDEVFQLRKRQSSMREDEEKKKHEKEKSDEESFEIIDTTTDNKLKETAQQIEQEKVQKEEEQLVSLDDFEHLSQYDPEDEFLRSNKSVSIIESILSKKSISQTSDFSIISSPQGKKVGSIISMSSRKSKNTIAFVDSNRDIYQEDVITQKIIYYISLFSDDVSSHLKNIRSKKMLLSNQKEAKQEEKIKEEDFMIDLDDVDQEFVNLILDVLEYYELFRLCLMVCNRYHMSDRLGRYIISVCSKYSNLHNHRFNLQLLKNTYPNQVWKERQRFASIIAHEAIHNVFTLIEPKFLSLKDINEPLTPANSLGTEAYRMMVDLGFWKKIVYIHNGYVGLSLCHKFFDKHNFEILMETLEFDQQSEDKKQVVLRMKNELEMRDYLFNLMQAAAITKTNVDDVDNLPRFITECDKDESKDIQNLAKVSAWLFNYPKMREFSKRDKQEYKEKIEAKIKEDQQKIIDNAYTVLKENVLDQKQDSFQKYTFAFHLAMTPGTIEYSRILRNIKENYDADSLLNLIKIYSQAIDILNLEKPPQKDNELIQALFSTFLISSLDDDKCTEEENIFKQYRHNYNIMSVNSSIFEEIQSLQQSMDSVQVNEFIGQKLLELRPKYFMVNNFRNAFINQYKEFLNQFNQKHAYFFDKTENAFILDMDAQFLMVPKNWTTKLLIVRLLNLCFSLAAELKQITYYDMANTEQELSIEEQIQIQFKDTQTLSKINRLAYISKNLHSSYTEVITNQINQLYKQLSRKEDFKQLLRTYWQKPQFQKIKYFYNEQSNEHMDISNVIDRNFYFRFDFGICHKKVSNFEGKNWLLTQAIKKFQKAVDLAYESPDGGYDENELDPVTDRLHRLISSLQYFIFADSYEILIELVRKEIKIVKTSDHPFAKTLLWLLQKFMIAIDIHVLLKYNSWSGAADSIFNFLNTFYQYLDNKDKVKLLSQAFYLTLIAKFGKVYLPDYTLRYLDVGFNLAQYYDGNLANERYDDFEDDHDDRFFLESEERVTITIDMPKDARVEKIAQDNLYNEGLYWINKVLTTLNEDEKSAVYKFEYIRLFNMLMSALVNDPKKSSKTLDQISKGFDAIANCSFDEYFNQYGLMEFEHQNPKGINDLMKQFNDTEDTYKHQFFAGTKFGGQMLAMIDVKKFQTDQAQVAINDQLKRSVFTEAKTIAGHYYLAYKMRKLYLKKREQFHLAAKAKQFIYEDRLFAKELGVEQLLVIDQLPGNQVLNLLKQFFKKQMMLRQMIISKYATNSLDIHYILAKASELQEASDAFMTFIKNFIQDKGRILTEFIDLKRAEENEFEKILMETKKRYNDIDSEINVWMNQKAEPNLIEVERKNTKYKIKWESLKLFDKKQKLLSVLKKKQAIIQGLA